MDSMGNWVDSMVGNGVNGVVGDWGNSVVGDGVDSMVGNGVDGVMGDWVNGVVSDGGDRVERDDSGLASWNDLVGSNGGLDLRQTLGVVGLGHGGVGGSESLGLAQSSHLTVG